jgi:hypothetical protein
MAGNDWQWLTVGSGWQWLATVDRVWSAEPGEPERYIKTSVAFHRNASCSNLIARIRWKCRAERAACDLRSTTNALEAVHGLETRC